MRSKQSNEMGWDHMPDGPLLTSAQERFDVLLTIDRGLQFQQNLTNLKLGVVVVMVPKNQLIYYESLAAEIDEALEAVSPGEVIQVPARRQ